MVLWYALTRDIRYSREYMGDLRNRVVGARIIEDGGSPYFYKWKPGDPLRYYDPQAFDVYIPSISTSTPFLHRMLIPLAELPFATAMRVWVVVLYGLYFAMVAYAFVFARAPKARAFVLGVALVVPADECLGVTYQIWADLLVDPRPGHVGVFAAALAGFGRACGSRADHGETECSLVRGSIFVDAGF